MFKAGGINSLEIPPWSTREPPAPMTAEQSEIIQREDHMREKFVNERDSVQDPHVLLEDVFEHSVHKKYVFSPLSAAEKAQPKLLVQHVAEATGPLGKPAVCESQATFNQRWHTFTNGALDGLNWSNVFAAGGSVVACLSESSADKSNNSDSDIDLFLYDLPTDELANAKVREIFATIEGNLKRQSSSTAAAAAAAAVSPELSVVRTHRAVTLLGQYPNRHIQVILRLFKSPAEVLLGFDLDSCAAGFDGHRVWAMERFRRALTKRYNLANLTRRSLVYESRLYKYGKRGFCVALPNVDLRRVDESLFDRPLRELRGLAKLLYLDRLASRRWRGWRSSKGRWISAPRPKELQTALAGSGDYSLSIPWGVHVRYQHAKAALDNADRAQFFARMKASREPGGPAFVHGHLFVTGLDGVPHGEKSWCRLCQQRKQLDDAHGAGLVGPKLIWTRDDPAVQDFERGRHRKLMTGGFTAPLVDPDWGRQALLPQEATAGDSAAEAAGPLPGALHTPAFIRPDVGSPAGAGGSSGPQRALSLAFGGGHVFSAAKKADPDRVGRTGADIATPAFTGSARDFGGPVDPTVTSLEGRLSALAVDDRSGGGLHPPPPNVATPLQNSGEFGGPQLFSGGADGYGASPATPSAFGGGRVGAFADQTPTAAMFGGGGSRAFHTPFQGGLGSASPAAIATPGGRKELRCVTCQALFPSVNGLLRHKREARHFSASAAPSPAVAHQQYHQQQQQQQAAAAATNPSAVPFPSLTSLQGPLDAAISTSKDRARTLFATPRLESAHELMFAATTPLAKCLLLLSYLRACSAVDESVRMAVKSAALSNSPLVLGALQAFEIDGNVQDLLETFKLIAANKQ